MADTETEEADPSIFKFKDEKTTADLYHEYSDSTRDGHIPLIIDNGTYNCRVGWASDVEPRLTFKNIIAKQRSKKESEAQIGNDISNIEVVRWMLKTQFDKNVVTHYDAQEQIFDYMFNHLGINTSGSVDHPIVLTETLANPNYCRQQMSELLFECYHVPKVAYGVDSLFSFYHNHPKPESANGVVVSFGYNTTHILPVVAGGLDAKSCRRINMGGAHLESFMHRLLQLKYPGHFAAITLSRAEELLKEHTYVSVDYEEDLDRWSHEDYYDSNVHKLQLPYNKSAQSVASSANTEQQKLRREQQVNRLKEMNAKRRQEKLVADQEKLQQLLSVQELLEDDEDDEAFSRALEELGFTTAAALQATINKLTANIEHTKCKILGVDTIEEPEPEVKEEVSYDLLNVPDDQLTMDQREAKKRQRMMKNASEGRVKAKKRRQQELEEERLMEEKRQKDFQGWLTDIRNKRLHILDTRTNRKQRKSDMAKRRTLASQQRMKIITALAQGTKKKKEDTFGQNDDDWNVYKEINKEGGDSDSEDEKEKLEELETMLREYDPEFEGNKNKQTAESAEFDLAEYYRVHLSSERIRVPELMFQPSMMGIEQAGISESLDFVLKKYPAEQQNSLVQYVYLTGGLASFQGLQERMERDLLSLRPFQSTFKVYTAKNPALDAWYGARAWSRSAAFALASITRAEYEEKGGEYLKEHAASNKYFTTPPAKPANG